MSWNPIKEIQEDLSVQDRARRRTDLAIAVVAILLLLMVTVDLYARLRITEQRVEHLEQFVFYGAQTVNCNLTDIARVCYPGGSREELFWVDGPEQRGIR